MKSIIQDGSGPLQQTGTRDNVGALLIGYMFPLPRFKAIPSTGNDSACDTPDVAANLSGTLRTSACAGKPRVL